MIDPLWLDIPLSLFKFMFRSYVIPGVVTWRPAINIKIVKFCHIPLYHKQNSRSKNRVDGITTVSAWLVCAQELRHVAVRALKEHVLATKC